VSAIPPELAAHLPAVLQLLQALVRSHPDPAALLREFDAVTARVQVSRAMSIDGAAPPDAACADALDTWRQLIEGRAPPPPTAEG
jgi:hypothetical protein